MNQTLLLTLQVVQSLGAIATAVSVIILLLKFRTKLKVTGEIIPNKADAFIVSVRNSTQYDSEIRSVSLWKGNPNSLFFSTSSLISSMNLGFFALETNPNTGGIIVPKGECIDISIPFYVIVNHYSIIGEAVGKVYDDIYVLVRDKNGNKYCVNTHNNIDFFRICSAQTD